ncbi:MAG: dual specificity protein phosphatase family protein [Anaerolineae bacterium]|nr:dual specificity protein phosphatase family protein [Anaerolineae bacterium]
MNTPFPEAYWVEPGLLLAGPYPAQRWAHVTSTKLERLLQAGIQLFVDLTEKDEALPYAHKLSGKARHERFPISDFDTPSPQEMVTILNALDHALHAQQRVYVHCLGGLGRTGTAIGCYLVRHGMDGDEALKTIRKLRSGTLFARSPSPETEAQQRMVLRWKVSQ